MLVLVLIAFSLRAQKHDMGFWGGGANYFGDLNTETSFRFVSPAAGVFYRFNIDNRISFRMNICGGRIWADDQYSSNLFEQKRNLHFFSNIYEFSPQLEFNFLPFSTTDLKYPFSPYVFMGFGIFKFNPSAKLDENTYALQPLGTEGQGNYAYPDLEPYKLTSTSFIVGGGFKFRLAESLGVQIEAGIRRTSTDYLDDASGVYANSAIIGSQSGPVAEYFADPSVAIFGEPVGVTGKMRGDASKNDSYLFFGIGFFYTINPYRCPFPKI